MPPDPKERFRELYAAYDRKELVQAGREHLQGDLRLRARRHTRWFWIAFALVLLFAVWLGILVIVWLLEHTSASADIFERQRRERIDRLGGE